MPPELVAALTAVLAALAAWIRSEVAIRREERRSALLRERLDDVQASVGAARRRGDRAGEEEEA